MQTHFYDRIGVMGKYCQLQLSCKDQLEADKVSSHLLNKHLIACAKSLPIESTFSWKGSIDKSNEILLLMESRVDLFDAVEKEIAKLHSYEVFVLTALPIVKVSKQASDWLADCTSDTAHS